MTRRSERCTLRRMNAKATDKLHYVRLPGGLGGRAEMVRMCYVLAGRPYVDVFHTFAEAGAAVTGKNPFKQFPFVETASGEFIFQSLAIMHHAAHGTSAWPSEPAQLTRALSVAMGGYDLYQWFGSFAADDLAAKQKFEDKRAPQFFGALDESYVHSPFAIGTTPCFADCIVHEAVAWCVRRNERCRNLLAQKPTLAAFQARFEALPAIAAFMTRQAQQRAVDDSV
jgi:glutathione S-transferase